MTAAEQSNYAVVEGLGGDSQSLQHMRMRVQTRVIQKPSPAHTAHTKLTLSNTHRQASAARPNVRHHVTDTSSGYTYLHGCGLAANCKYLHTAWLVGLGVMNEAKIAVAVGYSS
jgi:hypothetical protein